MPTTAPAIATEGIIPQLDLKRRLKLAREEGGFEQIELANLLGIAPRSVVNYEKGYTTPKRPIVYLWSRLTGVNFDWLYGTEDDHAHCPNCGSPIEPDISVRNRCCELIPQVIAPVIPIRP